MIAAYLRGRQGREALEGNGRGGRGGGEIIFRACRGDGMMMAMSSGPAAVQRLYDVCKKVFTSTSVPSEAQVSNVRAVLGNSSHHPHTVAAAAAATSALVGKTCLVEI